MVLHGFEKISVSLTMFATNNRVCYICLQGVVMSVCFRLNITVLMNANTDNVNTKYGNQNEGYHLVIVIYVNPTMTYMSYVRTC